MTIQPQRLVITTELTGRTSANLVAEVRPQVSGIIQKRLFTEGSDVKAGQVLYQIDPAPYQAALDNAAANLAAVQKNADRARAALEASLAGVTRQQATLDLARTNRERFEEAVQGERRLRQPARPGRHRGRGGRGHTAAAEAQVESDRKAVAAAEAAIQQAEAALKTARINLGYTAITAPISGRIGRSNVTEGALVTAYQPMALATIQQLDPMYVDVPQSTTELLRLRRRLEEGRLDQNGQNQKQGPSHPGRRHQISLGRDASIPRRHGRSDHRIGHPAGGLSQSEGRSAAGHVRPGGGGGRRQSARPS